MKYFLLALMGLLLISATPAWSNSRGGHAKTVKPPPKHKAPPKKHPKPIPPPSPAPPVILPPVIVPPASPNPPPVIVVPPVVIIPPVVTPPVVVFPVTGWWKPTASIMPMQWYINGSLNTGNATQMGLVSLSGATLPAPAVYDIDGEGNSAATVTTLHANGSYVICYVDVGTYEPGRNDSAQLLPYAGRAVAGWPGEKWLDVRQIAGLAPIMQARFQMCKDKGFDAIEPDNIDGYSNGNPWTAADQLAYNRAFAGWAHAIGLSIGLKNDGDQATALEPSFDWALDEECYTYSECDYLKVFTNANKAVWIAEYKAISASNCANAIANKWNAAQYKLDLNSGRTPC